jgi:hypothetical protein
MTGACAEQAYRVHWRGAIRLQTATRVGGMAERFNAVVLKTTGRKARGFESLSLRLD